MFSFGWKFHRFVKISANIIIDNATNPLVNDFSLFIMESLIFQPRCRIPHFQLWKKKSKSYPAFFNIPRAAITPVAAAFTISLDSPVPSPAANRFFTELSIFLSTDTCIE
jgi:hypothetical protein